MKKKWIAMALCAVMTVSLVGCSSGLSNEYINIKNYKGLEVAQVEKNEVTDKDVEDAIVRSLEASPLKKEITDRAVEMGDMINLDFVGSVDGVEFAGGSTQGKGTEIIVGQAGYIGEYGEYKGFEEQLVGHKKGENFDIKVRFPANYQEKELADQPAVFNITLNGIYSVEKVTEATDEWVQQNSEKSKTVEEFQKEVRENLITTVDNKYKATMRNGVLEALMEQVEVKKYPEGEVEKQCKDMESYYKQAAASMGLEFTDYLQTYFQMTEEDFQKNVKETAEKAVKSKLAVELLAKKKNLEPSDKQYEEKVKEYASQMGATVEQFEKAYSEEVIRMTIIQEAVADYLVESCVQVEASDAAK